MFYKLTMLALNLFMATKVGGFRSFNRASAKLYSVTTFLRCAVENKQPIIAPHQIYVGNLPFEVDAPRLESILNEKAAGIFSKVRVLVDRKTGKSKGHGYIDFDDKDAAEKVLASLQGLEIDGREIKVTIATPKEEREKTPGETAARLNQNKKLMDQSNSIFIGNLDFDVNESMITDLCNSRLGEGKIKSVRLIVDRETNRKKGFGYIDFVDEDTANQALLALKGADVLGRQIRTDSIQRKDEDSKFVMKDKGYRQQVKSQHSVFLGNLNWEVTTELVEEMLNDILGPELFIKVRMAVDKETGRPKGFAHIDFKDAAGAERAVAELNGIELLGRQLKVDHAQRKDQSVGVERKDFNREDRRYEDNRNKDSFGSW